LNEQLVSYNISITRLAIALNRENLEPILEFQNENKSYSDDFNLYYKDVLGLSDATLYNIKKRKKQLNAEFTIVENGDRYNTDPVQKIKDIVNSLWRTAKKNTKRS
jgi:hypothetical protein